MMNLHGTIKSLLEIRTELNEIIETKQNIDYIDNQWDKIPVLVNSIKEFYNVEDYEERGFRRDMVKSICHQNGTNWYYLRTGAKGNAND